MSLAYEDAGELSSFKDSVIVVMANRRKLRQIGAEYALPSPAVW